jgi:hypothetical protein
VATADPKPRPNLCTNARRRARYSRSWTSRTKGLRLDIPLIVSELEALEFL